MATLALQLLTHHERPEVLRLLFNSLYAQTDQDWKLFWLDNGSTEEERASMHAVSHGAMMIEQQENIGFAGGHQKLYEQHDADYVLCLNADAILEPGYIASLRQFLDTHPETAAVSGKIFRWDFNTEGQIVKSDIIDSLGLARTCYEKVYDIGGGMTKSEFQMTNEEVFGVSGCLPIYRRSAVGAQLFDPSYFLYKEDIDLAYRLNRNGWKAWYVSSAVAYHHRTFRPKTVARPYRAQLLSYRNHLHNLRHLTLLDWAKRGWMIIPYEFLKFIYIFFRVFLSAIQPARTTE